MAYEIVKTKSIKTTATKVGYQFTFVKIDTSGQLATPSAGAYAVGVLQDKPGAGSPGAVCFPGDITKVQVGVGGLVAGDEVATDALGRAILAWSGAYVLGVALATQSTVGALTDIIYQPKAHKM